MTHLFDLAVISVALALLCGAIMTATAELLGRKPRWRFFFVAFGWFWFGFGLQLQGRSSS